MDVQNSFKLEPTSDIVELEEMNDPKEMRRQKGHQSQMSLTRRMTMDTNWERIGQTMRRRKVVPVKMTQRWGTEVLGRRMMGV